MMFFVFLKTVLKNNSYVFKINIDYEFFINMFKISLSFENVVIWINVSLTPLLCQSFDFNFDFVCDFF